jgi:hypothetical protein
MIQINQSCDPRIHALAIKLAHQCRYIIQAILREEERGDCDREFYTVIREGLEDFQKGQKP